MSEEIKSMCDDSQELVSLVGQAYTLAEKVMDIAVRMGGGWDNRNISLQELVSFVGQGYTLAEKVMDIAVRMGGGWDIRNISHEDMGTIRYALQIAATESQAERNRVECADLLRRISELDSAAVLERDVPVLTGPVDPMCWCSIPELPPHSASQHDRLAAVIEHQSTE